MSPAGEPMKATLSDRAFNDPAWVFERKLDGIRAAVRRDGGEVTLTSRTGKSLTSAYPELVEALEAEPATEFAADGEIVAFDGSRTSFEKLQGRMGIHDSRLARMSGIPVFLYLFDLLEFDGHDLTGLPLRKRKAALRRAFSFHGPVRFTPHRNERGEEFFAEACEKGWEGLIAKRASSPYVHSRSRDWLKLKCSFEQELVIGGFTPPQGARSRFGALLVGYHEDGGLRYAGKVGTGFSERTLRDLGDHLERLERPDSPFTRGTGLPRNARWVEPRLVAQIAFGEWTRDGKLRHPRYLGLREDKPAAEVVREMVGGRPSG
jgi:bifunctional non-homologous end joining protein LigD